MRVYELAREAGVTSADVLSAAEKCGADVSSAISTIDEGDVAALKLAVSQLDRRDAEAKRAAKRARSSEIRKSPMPVKLPPTEPTFMVW